MKNISASFPLAALYTLAVALWNAEPAMACGNTTYVHPSLAGNRTAYGQVWSNTRMVVAANNRSLRGRTIRLCTSDSNRCVLVRVIDYSPNSEFDLSQAAFQQLAPLSRGRICTRIR